MNQTIQPFPIGPNAAPGIPYGPALAAILSAEGFEAARREISGWPGYAPTPLHRLSGLAEAAGVADIWYKDEGGLETVMGGLAAGACSMLAWDLLWAGADDFLTVPDPAALEVMRLPSRGLAGDPAVVAGESAVAGLAGALGALQHPQTATALGLGPSSRVLVFGTKGATDPKLYREIVGRTPEAVAGGGG